MAHEGRQPFFGMFLLSMIATTWFVIGAEPTGWFPFRVDGGRFIASGCGAPVLIRSDLITGPGDDGAHRLDAAVVDDGCARIPQLPPGSNMHK